MNTTLLDAYSACTTANVNRCIRVHQSLQKTLFSMFGTRSFLLFSTTKMIANCKLVDMPLSNRQVVHQPLLQSCLNEASVIRVALRVTVNQSAQRVRQFGSKTCLAQWFSNFRVVANSTLHKLQQQNQQNVVIYNSIYMITEWTSACACRDGSRW